MKSAVSIVLLVCATLTQSGICHRSIQPLCSFSTKPSDTPSTSRCLSWRGGDQREPSTSSVASSPPPVSVNPDEALPASIAGASLTAFGAAARKTPGISSTSSSSSSTTTTTHAAIDDYVDYSYTAGEETEEVEETLLDPAEVGEAVTSVVAKRLANLKERVLPAVLMLGMVGLVSYFLKEDGLILLTALLQGGMYQEITRVIGGDFAHVFYKWWWFVTASVAINVPRMLPWAAKEVSAVVYGMTILGITSSVVRFNAKGADVEEFRDFLRQAAVSFLGALLVMVPSGYWISTLEEFGMKWVGIPAALVVINDTMAYFFGITMGKHPLLPVISPSKTWEGFLGAGVSTMVAAYFLMESKQDALVLSSMVSVVGPFGGFLASMIKRAYSQKDFGSLFPGHGGFVDRLDCQLVLAPFVFLYLTLIKGGRP